MIAVLARIVPWACSLQHYTAKTPLLEIGEVFYVSVLATIDPSLFIEAPSMSMIGYVKRVDRSLANQLMKGEGETDGLYGCSKEDEQGSLCFSLDKTWDGIDFLFQNGNRRNNPNSAYLGAKKSAYLEKEFGYGQVMLITASEVARIGDQLAQISDEDFSKRIEAHHTSLIEQEVYPFSEGETVADIDGYVTPYFKKLSEFFAKASKAGDSVLFWIL